MDDFPRREFDEVLLEVFPDGRWSKIREEHSYGWTDTIDLNLFQIRIRMYTEDQPRMKRGDLMVEIHGNRTTLDRSTVLLWHEKSCWRNFKPTLKRLRQILLGLAAAILRIAGTDNPKVEEPTDRWQNQFDDEDVPF